MIIKKSHLASAVVIILLVGSLLISIAHSTPSIMVLHSYSTDYVWANLINQGVNDAFQRSKSDVKVRYFYMDTNDPEYARKADQVEQDFLELMESFNPQIIIAFDDPSQNIISKHYVGHSDIDVIFAGVGYSVDQYGYSGGDNIAGIFEHKPLSAIQKVIAELEKFEERDEPADILFLADKSLSSYGNTSYLAAQIWEGVEYHGVKQVADYDEWKKFIIEESGNYDYILVSGYRQLGSEGGGWVDPEVVASWTQANSQAALLGMNVYNSEDGILISVGVSPYEQGSVALKMALRIIGGDSPGEIGYRYPDKYILALSENALYNQNVQQDYKKSLLRHANVEL